MINLLQDQISQKVNYWSKKVRQPYYCKNDHRSLLLYKEGTSDIKKGIFISTHVYWSQINSYNIFVVIS